MHQHRFTNLASGVTLAALMLLGAGSNAGEVDQPTVEVDLVARTASCSFVGARYHGTDEESCLCRVQILAPGEKPYAVCEATDAERENLTCYSEETAYVDAVIGVRDYSHIEFSSAPDRNGDLHCTSLFVSTSSAHLPKPPVAP